MNCHFCNTKSTSEVCDSCKKNKMISKSDALKQYGLKSTNLSALFSIKHGKGKLYIKKDVIDLFKSIANGSLVTNDKKKIYEIKKTFDVEKNKEDILANKKNIIKKIVDDLLIKSDKKYVELYSKKIPDMIHAIVHPDICVMSAAAEICFKMEKYIEKKRVKDEYIEKESLKAKLFEQKNKYVDLEKIKLEKMKLNDFIDKYKMSHLPTEITNRTIEINMIIANNFNKKYENILKNMKEYKNYINDDEDINLVIMKMNSLTDEMDERTEKILKGLEKHNMDRCQPLPYDSQKYFTDYVNGTCVNLSNTIDKILKTRNFWRIVSIYFNTDNPKSKNVMDIKEMYINDKISDNELIKKFTSANIKTIKGWSNFKKNNIVSNYGLKKSVRSMIDEFLFDFFDSDEIDLTMKNMQFGTEMYILVRCRQLTLTFEKIMNMNNTWTFEISKPVKLMGDKF